MSKFIHALNRFFLNIPYSLVLTGLLYATSANALINTDSDADNNLYKQAGSLDTSTLDSVNVKAAQTNAQQVNTQMQQAISQQRSQNQQYLQEVGRQIIQGGTRNNAVQQPNANPNTPATSATLPSQSVAAQPSNQSPTTQARPSTRNVSTSSAPASNDTNQSGSGSGWNYGF